MQDVVNNDLNFCTFKIWKAIFWSFIAPGPHPLPLYGREQLRHPANLLPLCFIEDTCDLWTCEFETA